MAFKQLFDPETSTLTYILMDPVNSLDLPDPARIDVAVPANIVCGNDDRGELDTRVVEHAA